MSESTFELLRYITFALVVMYFVLMFAQQKFAQNLAATGNKWTRKDISGHFFGTMEGNYWLWFLFSLRWRALPTRRMRIICLCWTMTNFILLGVLMVLFSIAGYMAVSA